MGQKGKVCLSSYLIFCGVGFWGWGLKCCSFAWKAGGTSQVVLTIAGVVIWFTGGFEASGSRSFGRALL